MRFENDWVDTEGFVDLGTYDIHRNGKLERFDLYGWASADMSSVTLGARYGNDGPEYLSGKAFRKPDGSWDILCGDVLGVAAARMFARLYEQERTKQRTIDGVTIIPFTPELEQVIYHGVEPFSEEGFACLRKWAKVNDAYFYSAPNESFSLAQAVLNAKRVGASAVLVENLS